MMRKDWFEIAMIGDEQLQRCLIAAEGKIAEGLFRDFPDCFIAEGEEEKEEPLTRKELLFSLLKKVRSIKEAIIAVRILIVPYRVFSLTGHCWVLEGDASGWVYRYSTPFPADPDYYCCSLPNVGEEIEWSGARWLVVYTHPSTVGRTPHLSFLVHCRTCWCCGKLVITFAPMNFVKKN